MEKYLVNVTLDTENDSELIDFLKFFKNSIIHS